MRAWCDIAELTNTKYLNGGLVVRCTAGLPFLFEAGLEVSLVPPVLDAPRRVVVADAEPNGPDGGVVWFEEVADADAAKVLVGCHCLARREDVRGLATRAVVDGSELDVAGWETYDEDEGYLGLVVEVREMPGQLMLVIDRQTCSELLVPLVDEFVAEIDESSHALRLSLPAGLLEL